MRERYTLSMAYHIYHTEAIILGGRPSGEGDKMLYCYTRELGLISLHAKSLRESRSRLRYVLQMFSHAELDLIHGKHGWKLISARPVDSFSSLWGHSSKRFLYAQHAQLIRRLIQGEERNELLFDEILSGLHFLKDLNEEAHLRTAELIFVVRLLYRLGYWEQKEDFQMLLKNDPWTMDTLAFAEARRSPLLLGINQALRETQL